MKWGWLFDLEVWLLRLEQPRLFGEPPGRRRILRTLRRPVSRLTRRLERRGAML